MTQYVDMTFADVEAEISKAVRTERERCAAIVQAARAGEIDKDFRSIISRIKDGSTDHVKDSEG